MVPLKQQLNLSDDPHNFSSARNNTICQLNNIYLGVRVELNMYPNYFLLLEEPPVAQPLRISQHFMQSEGSSPFSHQPSTGIF